MNDQVHGKYNEAEYWEVFNAKLATLPVTSDNVAVRAQVIEQTMQLLSADGVPEDVAQLVHRLIFDLGPQVSSSVLDDVAAKHERHRRELLRQGLSPELLG